MPDTPRLPESLQGHEVPDERLALIRTHVTMLAETARTVSDRLPLGADGYDVIAVLERKES